jgi:phosphonate transport system substrate-binding protein
VAPQFERRQLFRIWQPIVDDLQRRTGLRFELVTSLSVGDYDSDVKNGRYDFIYVNPHLMPLIEKQPGYQPLIRDSAPLHGILVVRKDSPLQRVEDLRGKTLAVPSLAALAASLLLRAELDRDFGVKPQAIIAKTHSSVFLHVVNGLADAGGSVQKALAEQDERVRDSLKVLHRTRDVPSHPIAGHQRVPVKVREQVRQAFLEMSADPQGRALLAEVPMREAVAASVDDYQVLKTLKLDSYLTQ